MPSNLDVYALAQKAKSERLFMHYALGLASLVLLGGTALIVIGAGDHVDIIVSTGNIEARFINATPGIALVLVAAAIFWLSKPRRLKFRTEQSEATRQTSYLAADALQGDVTDIEMLTEILEKIEEKEFGDASTLLENSKARWTKVFGDESFYSVLRINKRLEEYHSEKAVTVGESDLATATGLKSTALAPRAPPERITNETNKNTVMTTLYQSTPEDGFHAMAVEDPEFVDDLQRELDGIRAELNGNRDRLDPDRVAFLEKEDRALQKLINEARRPRGR